MPTTERVFSTKQKEGALQSNLEIEVVVVNRKK